MGTDDTHAGLPFAYRVAPATTAQPTCRAISLDELTRRGPVVLLAGSHEEVGVGAAGLVLETLASSYVTLFTLRDHGRSSYVAGPDDRASLPGAGSGKPSEARSRREPLWSVLDEGPGRQRLRGRTLRRPDGHLDEHAANIASVRVADELDRLCASTLLVATVPMASTDHRFLDQVAQRVATRCPAVARWHFAALRQVPSGAAYQLRSAATVRTFDVRRWTDDKSRMSSPCQTRPSSSSRSHLPELFWQDDDVTALSRIGATTV